MSFKMIVAYCTSGNTTYSWKRVQPLTQYLQTSALNQSIKNNADVTCTSEVDLWLVRVIQKRSHMHLCACVMPCVGFQTQEHAESPQSLCLSLARSLHLRLPAQTCFVSVRCTSHDLSTVPSLTVNPMIHTVNTCLHLIDAKTCFTTAVCFTCTFSHNKFNRHGCMRPRW